MPRSVGRGCWAGYVRFIAFFLPLLVVALIDLRPVQGQIPVPDNIPGQLQQQLGQRLPAVAPEAPQSNLVLQPDPINRRPLAPSRLEQIMSERAGSTLQQFGYDQLGSGRSVTMPQSGAVQNDYVLGIGDELLVTLRGQENSEQRVLVNRNGQVLLPRLNPVPAAGRMLGNFSEELQAMVQRAYISTTAFVSVSRVRQISVLVSGEVNNPGLRLVTGQSSVVDALALSGGIRKTGSLRNVRIQRGGREIAVDLYSLITARGRAASMGLTDGDRIVVPLLGPTVAVSGLVRQPGIYELLSRRTSIAASELLELAGGQEVRGLYRLSILRIEADGRSTLVNAQAQNATLRDSEILFVQLGANQVVNQATLSGGSGLAGTYALGNTRLTELLRAPGAIGDSPYPLFGLIVRRNRQTLVRSLIAFTPVATLAGREDVALQSDDVVRPFSTEEARLLNYIISQYLIRLAQADLVLRNPVKEMVQSEALSTAFNAVQRRSEDERQLASFSTYIGSVPSDIQRNAILELLNQPAPGSPLASARADQLRRNNEAMALTRAATGQPVAAGIPGAPSVTELPQKVPVVTPQPQTETLIPERPELAANYQDAASAASGFAGNLEVQTFGQLVRQLNVDPLILINFLAENRARLDGAIRGPGDYLIGPSTSLQDMVYAAGGTVNWADQKGVELITTLLDRESGKGSTLIRTLQFSNEALSSYIVRPSDQLRFSQVPSASIGSVTIQGQVRSPGTFSVLRGDRLSDVLARAGGLTEVAYPFGTVFLRQSAAQQEREGYIRAASEIQNQLIAAMTRPSDTRLDPAAYASMQGLVQELRTQRALGRISVIADPSLLAAQPEIDPLVEPGDIVYVPQRPSTISVLGLVLQPGNFPYRPNETIESYIKRAGGFARNADVDQTFLVLPDGTARRWERSWFRFDSVNALPPGSTIVVPRDMSPFDLRQTVLNITQIISQLAVSIASIAVINR
jgi:polysaccharide export outer membrane protein